jgi:hypothetical protein
MATKKPQLAQDEKFEKQDFDLFDALVALDKKDYGYYDRLTEEQQKKFVSFMLLQWMSTVKSNPGVQGYYLMSTNHHANIHMFNENVQKHPKLQWLMLCAASPGLGKQFHQWIPNITPSVSKLKTLPKAKELKEYFKKIYPKASDSDLQEFSEEFVKQQKRKMFLAEKFPNLKFDEIEVLNQTVTDEDIRRYEEDSGN